MHCIEHLERKLKRKGTDVQKQEGNVWKHIRTSSDQKDRWSTHNWDGNKRHVRLGLSSEVSEPAPSPGKVTGSVTSVSGGG